MSIYFTSDLHFNHNKEFVWKERGFSSVAEMNEAILKNFNSIVTNEDDLYILGDLMLEDNEKGLELLGQLPGKIHIILGNHDTNSRIKLYKQLPNVIEITYGARIRYHKWSFFLSHYPTLVNNMDGRKMWNISGHTHSNDKFEKADNFIYNVAVDAHSCYPVSIEKIVEDIKAYKEGKNNER